MFVLKFGRFEKHSKFEKKTFLTIPIEFYEFFDQVILMCNLEKYFVSFSL